MYAAQNRTTNVKTVVYKVLAGNDNPRGLNFYVVSALQFIVFVFYFWLIRAVSSSYVHQQHFRPRSLAFICHFKLSPVNSFLKHFANMNGTIYSDCSFCCQFLSNINFAIIIYKLLLRTVLVFAYFASKFSHGLKTKIC